MAIAEHHGRAIKRRWVSGHRRGAQTLHPAFDSEGLQLQIRRVRQQDRRVVELALTPAGHAMTEKYLPRLVELYNYLLEDFTRDESDKLIDLLIRFNHKLCDPTKAKAA